MEYNLLKGLVTHVIDPSNFWMRIGKESDMKLFCAYQEKLDAFYNEDRWKYTCNIDQLCPGYLVVVNSSSGDSRSDQHHWQRAQVTRVDVSNNTADVFFVDLGYTAIVRLDDCREITPALFQFVAPQASRVSLAGIKPLAKSWTSRASSLLEKQTNQDVVTLLVNYDDASGSYSVVIYSKQDNGVWQSLVHAMQHNELALGTDDNIQEYLTEDVVNECLERLENGHETSDSDGADDQNETTLLADEEEETENWHEDFGASEITRKRQDSSDTTNGVIGFDYGTLMQTQSISISKMQREKGWETQEQTKSRLAQGLQRLDSDPSAQDDQDWDAVQDVDFHSEIVSQIYHGGLERQESNDGLRRLIEESKVLDLGPKKPKAEEHNKNLSNHSYNKKLPPAEAQDEGAVSQGLSEMESYELEKQIKKILMNEEEKESDFICASVYSVVEPDVDTPSDHLQVVIYAILEHVIQNSGRQSEVAFAILETYSDASAFGKAIIDVILELKDRYLKKVQSVRLKSTHNKFAKMMALVFKQAEDWNSSVCKTVQDHVVALVERWIVFNKARQVCGDHVINSEFMYLESAETFLLQCRDLLESEYESELKNIMAEIRFKLLHEGTASWIRACLLDLLLSLNSGQVHREEKATCNVAVQTEPMPGDDRQRVLYEEQQTDISKTFATPAVDEVNQEFPETHFTDCQSFPDSLHASTDLSSQLKRKEKRTPKSIRNLSPRLFKKYLQEHDTTDVQPLSHPTVDNAINHQHIEPHATSPDHQGLPTATESTNNVSLVSQPSAERNPSSFSNYFRETFIPNEPIRNNESSSMDMEEKVISDEPAQDSFRNVDKADIGVHVDYCDDISSYPMNYSAGSEEHWEDMDRYNGDLRNTESTMAHVYPSQMKEPEILTTAESTNESHLIIEEDDQNLEGVPDRDSDTCDYIIRYTSQQLRDLNPFADQPKPELGDLIEPKEVLEKMKEMIRSGKSDTEEKSFKWRQYSSGSTKPRQNYVKEDPDLAMYLKYNKITTAKDRDVFGSSVDPNPIDSAQNSEESLSYDNAMSTLTQKGSSFQDKASYLIKPKDSVSKSAEDIGNEDEELWHDDALGPNGDFLKPKKNNDSARLLSRKAKKKKGKGKPLDEFLQEEADRKAVREDESGDDEDLFSSEALEMYDELERQGVGNDIEDIKGARVLMPSKIGSHVTSSSKCSSLFSSIRAEQSGQGAPKPWCPGRKRFCTRCGSEYHVVYDCTEHSSRLLF